VGVTMAADDGDVGEAVDDGASAWFHTEYRP
jgi:hypothetical protein